MVPISVIMMCEMSGHESDQFDDTTGPQIEQKKHRFQSQTLRDLT